MFGIAIVSSRGTPFAYLTKSGKWWYDRYARQFDTMQEAAVVMDRISPKALEVVVEENGYYDVGGLRVVELG